MAKPEDQGADVIPYERVELEAVREALLGNGQLRIREEDPDIARARIVSEILDGSLDEAFASRKPTASDDVVDTPMSLLSFDWAASDFDEGPGLFAVANCALLRSTFAGSAGDIIKVSLGGDQIIAQLYKLAQNGPGTLPRDIVVRKKSKPTKRGFYPKWLEFYNAPTPEQAVAT
jgi:hypothetical protein